MSSPEPKSKSMKEINNGGGETGKGLKDGPKQTVKLTPSIPPIPILIVNLRQEPTATAAAASLSQAKPKMPLLPKIKADFNWPFPNFKHPHRLWNMKSSITLWIVGVSSKIVLNWMNTTKVYNEDVMLNAIFRRPAGTPLITVSNHESCWDDPMVLAKFFKPHQFLFNTGKMRWSVAAHDICFELDWHGKFFSLGKCIPLVRGHGVHQRAVDFALDRLNQNGDWLHVFPEGRINMERQELYRLKWGIGRVISECKKTPIVIPIWHTGMADVVPNHEPYYPRWRKSVVINVGQPLQMNDVLKSVENLSSLQRRKVITDFIQEELIRLRKETLKITNDLVKK